MVLSVALNYGGRAEIVDASRAAMQKLISAKRRPEDLSEADIASELYTRDLPELDLLVRTSGELRISNFLLWQAAYSEYWTTPVLWPDFNAEHLDQAIGDYARRKRRFSLGSTMATNPGLIPAHPNRRGPSSPVSKLGTSTTHPTDDYSAYIVSTSSVAPTNGQSALMTARNSSLRMSVRTTHFLPASSGSWSTTCLRSIRRICFANA